jgi:hypothetical protein
MCHVAKHEFTSISPLATSVISFANTSVNGCTGSYFYIFALFASDRSTLQTEWHSEGLGIALCYERVIKAYSLRGHGILRVMPFHASLFSSLQL